MGIMPVEFERACERRWIAKFRQPVPTAPLHEVDQNDSGKPNSPAAESRVSERGPWPAPCSS
jgi:hypothetical protein